jgi:hypothetical protein
MNRCGDIVGEKGIKKMGEEKKKDERMRRCGEKRRTLGLLLLH